MVTRKKRPLHWEPGVGSTVPCGLETGRRCGVDVRGALHFKPQIHILLRSSRLAGSAPRQWSPLGPHANSSLRESLLTFWAGELSEGGQRDDSVGDGVHGVQHAGDIVGTAGLDAADGVRLLLADPEGNQNTRANEKAGTNTPGETRVQRGGQEGAAGSETAPSENCSGPHSPAAPWGCLRALPANGIGTPMPETHPSFHLPSLGISEAWLFAQCMS